MQGAFYYGGMYDMQASRTPRAVCERVLRSLAVGSLVLWILFYVLNIEFLRGVSLAAIALAALVLPAWRLLYLSVSSNVGLLRRVVILGVGDLARELADIVQSRPDLGLELSVSWPATARRWRRRTSSSGPTRTCGGLSSPSAFRSCLLPTSRSPRDAACRAVARGEVPGRRGRGGRQFLRTDDGQQSSPRAEAEPAHLRPRDSLRGGARAA